MLAAPVRVVAKIAKGKQPTPTSHIPTQNLKKFTSYAMTGYFPSPLSFLRPWMGCSVHHP
jgi:hypothetical protein